MSKKCELTGVSPLKGHNVSHSNNKTKRKFLPNLKKVNFKSDILKKNIKLNKKKDLLLYSYRVAGTVGLMMAKILRVNKKSSLKSAINLGIAMQLTNISRDVVEDLNFGRSYINFNFEEIKSTIKLSDSYYEKSFYSCYRLRMAVVIQ